MFQKIAKPECLCIGIFRGNSHGVEITSRNSARIIDHVEVRFCSSYLNLPMADEAKIPVVGLFTGTQTLYTPLRHWVINERASYAIETREQMEGLWKTLGYKKIAVIYPDDAFGAAVLDGVKSALKTKGAEPVAAGSYPRQTVQFKACVRQIQKRWSW